MYESVNIYTQTLQWRKLKTNELFRNPVNIN
jgi:hypothetical protein